MRPLALAVSLGFVDTGAQAATITVTDGGDAGTATTCTLRQAIVSANKDAHGISACADGSGDDTIEFDDALVGSTITLGGTELAVAVKSPLTIIGSGQTIDANHASRVMYVGFTTFSASHLNLVNGDADGNSGGGMFVLSSTVSLDDVGISGNRSDYAAGIAAFNYSTLTVTSSTISGNVAARKGGGVETVNGSTVEFENSVVSGNSASRGAGVFLSFYSQLSLNRSTISGNTATSAPTLTGGGIYGYRCTKIGLTDSTVSANTGNYRGGGIVAVECPLAVVNSTVAENTALAGNGGGIYLEHSSGTLVNATVSGNSAQDAGGIFVYKGTLTLANTILSANAAGAGNADLDSAQSTVTAQYSLLGSVLDANGLADPGEHNLFTDNPGLGALQDNGGATWTMALLAGSPAIDAGGNALAQDTGHMLDCDQRVGFPRMVDGIVDIGAFEYQPDRIFATAFEALP